MQPLVPAHGSSWGGRPSPSLERRAQAALAGRIPAGKPPRPAAVIRTLASWMLAVLGGLALWALHVSAVGDGRIELALDEVVGDGWRAEAVQVVLELDDHSQTKWSVSASRVDLPGLAEPVRDLHLKCTGQGLHTDRLDCSGLQLALDIPRLGSVVAQGSLHWTRGGSTVLVLRQGRAAGGRFGLELRGSAGAWELVARGRDLDATRALAPFAGKGGEFTGRLGFELRAALAGPGSAELSAHLTAADLGFTEPAGLHEAQGLGMEADIEGRLVQGVWEATLRLGLNRGVLYWDPWILEPAGDPLRVEASGTWRPTRRRLELDRFWYRDAQALEAQGSLRLHLPQRGTPQIEQLAMDRLQLRLPRAYETYLRPALVGTVLDDLETGGRVQARFQLQQGKLSMLDAVVRALQASDRMGRFAVQGLDGHLAWARQGRRRSRLAVEGVSFYRLATGAFGLDLVQRDGGLELGAPVQIPVFDGRLDIQRFELRDLLDPMAGWGFDAVLTPVSMPRVTRALGWPEMEGTLSGVVPDVTYRDGTLRVGGALLVRVFDGAVVVDHLNLERPFGVVPVLRADVAVRNLDLDLLTRRFPLGRITGRLGGYVRGLVLEDWSPVSFDAWLGTPEDDHSRHRISQRAVENLSSLGGGPTAALSGGFMRLFEEFPYDRLGLGCRLDKGVCHMRGVAPAKGGGYYIVKGKGLPHIDVIGYRTEVDWAQLVDRLLSLGVEGGPVVE